MFQVPYLHTNVFVTCLLPYSTFWTSMKRSMNQNSAKVELLVDKNLPMKPCLSGSGCIFGSLTVTYLAELPHKKLTHTLFDLLCLDLFKPFYPPEPIWIEWKIKLKPNAIYIDIYWDQSVATIKRNGVVVPIAFLCTFGNWPYVHFNC